jgi:hypothetical protein
MAQTLSLYDFQPTAEARDKLSQFPIQSRSGDCLTTWLLVPEDPANPGNKLDLPLGDVRPLLNSYITNGDSLGSFYIGKATNCEIICTPQVSAYGAPKGINYAAFMDGGNYNSYEIDRPGKYIIVGQSKNGNCHLAETFQVSCPPTSGITDTVYQKVMDTLVVEFLAVTTGVNEEVDFDDLHVFPNPVKNELTISHSENEVLIKVYDLSGNQTLLSQNVAPMGKIDFTHFVPGTYIVEASTIKDGQIAKKFEKIIKQ